MSISCQLPKLCPSCGQTDHPETSCPPSPICVNCEGNHSPRYRGCPTYKKEYEINKIKTIDRISYIDAKRKYSQLHPVYTTSYAQKATTNKRMVSIGTQCDQSAETFIFPKPITAQSSTSPNICFICIYVLYIFFLIIIIVFFFFL